LLVPASNDVLTMHPVSSDVNNVRNKGPQLIEAIDPTAVEAVPPAGSLF
jgi:putative SOS response-associated peptidase YedK